MDVLLVRHAEPAVAAAAERSFDDGTGLSERGQAQARALGLALARSPLRCCLVSPLERARETARLALAGREVPVEINADFAEGALGALQGLGREEALRRFPEDLRFGHTVVARIAATGRTAPDGESREQFLSRARRASSRVQRELSAHGGPALVISHGGLLNYLIQLLLGLPLRDEAPFGFEFAGGVRVLSYAERGREEAPGFGPFPMLSFTAWSGETSPTGS
jgi:probable phosphoglycerate mutase